MGLFNKSIKADKDQRVVLIGEILVDTISHDNVEQPYTFGGSTANISVNLKHLGCDPLLFAAVGNDKEANFLLEQLNQYGVGSSHVIKTSYPTTKVVITNVTDNPVPTFYRNADYHIGFTSDIDDAIKQAKVLHFSYWPLSKQPSLTTILQAIDTAKKHGVTVGFDPNYHEDLVENDSITIDDLKTLITRVDILKPSLDDAQRLFGHRDTPMEYLKEFQDLGPQLIILTLGKDGALVSYKGTVTKLDSLATKIVDVTGAGDAFWSGLYAGMLHNQSILDSVHIGLLCSAYALKQSGAITAIPHVSELIKQIG